MWRGYRFEPGQRHGQKYNVLTRRKDGGIRCITLRETECGNNIDSNCADVAGFYTDSRERPAYTPRQRGEMTRLKNVPRCKLGHNLGVENGQQGRDLHGEQEYRPIWSYITGEPKGGKSVTMRISAAWWEQLRKKSAPKRDGLQINQSRTRCKRLGLLRLARQLSLPVQRLRRIS